MKCLDHNTALYKAMIRQNFTKKQQAQIEDKFNQDGFKEWYGNGALNSYKEPELINDTYLINDKGQKMTLHDLLNDKSYEDTLKYKKDITYNDKIKNFLEEAKKGLLSDINQFKNSDYVKDLEKLFNTIEKVDENDYVNALVEYSDYIIKTVHDFEERIYNHDRVRTSNATKEDKDKENTRYKKALIHFKNFLVTFSKIKNLETPKIDNLDVKEVIKKLKEIESRVTELQNKVAEEIVEQNRNLLEHYITNPEILKGAKDFLAASIDESGGQLWFDASADSTTPFIAAIDKYVKSNMEDLSKEEKEILEKFNKLIKDNPDFEQINDRIVNKKTGQFIQKYQNEFYDKLHDYTERLGNLKLQGKEKTEAYSNLLNEYFEFKRNNQEQKYVKEYYEALSLLTPEAREVKVKIDEQKSKILAKKELQEEDYKELKRLDYELKELKSSVTKSGIKKTGKDLEIAESLYNYSKKLNKFYETKSFSQNLFDIAKQEANKEGKLEEFLKNNTTEQFSKEFWDKFKKITSKVGKTGKIESIEKKIKMLLIRYTNSKGEVKVHKVPQKIQDEVKKLEEDKKLLKKEINKTIDIEVIEQVSKDFKNLVQITSTSVYNQIIKDKEYDLLHDKITKEEYQKWYNENHIENPYSQKVEPISLWTTIRPKNKKYISNVPNKRWQTTDIKNEFLNPNFNSIESIEKKIKMLLIRYTNSKGEVKVHEVPQKIQDEVKKLEEDKKLLKNASGYANPTNEWINSEYKNLSDKDKKVLNEIQKLLLYLTEHSQNNRIRQGNIPTLIKGKLKENKKEKKDEKIIDKTKEIVRFLPFKGMKQLIKEELPVVQKGMTDEQVQEIEKKRAELTKINKLYHSENINYNLQEVLPAFIHAALENKYKSKLEVDMKLFQEQIKAMKVIKTNAKGETYEDKISKELHEVSAIGSNMEKKFKGYLANWYGETLDEGLLTDVIDNIKPFTSLVYLGFNVFSGLNNLIVGNIMTKIEAAGGRNFSSTEHKEAGNLYFANLPGLIADSGKDIPSNYLTGFIRHFDIEQSQDELNGQPNTSIEWIMHKAKKLKDAAYFMLHKGEHQIQNTTLLAMSKSHRIIDGKIINFSKWYETKKKEINNEDTKEKQIEDIKYNIQLKKDLKKEFKSYTSILDAYNFKDGKSILKEDLKINEEDIKRFKQKVIGVIQKINGIYGNNPDKALIEKYALGRLGMMFRHHLVPMWNSRFGRKFGKTTYNERLEDYESGSYITFGKYIGSPFVKSFKDFQKEQDNKALNAFKAILGGFNALIKDNYIRWHSLTEIEKADVKKIVSEMLFLVSVIALGYLAKSLKGSGDDDDKLKAKMLTLTLLQCDRLFGELTTFNIGIIREGNRLITSPSPILNTFNNIAKIGYDMFNIVNPFTTEESTVFKSGIHHGKSKLGVHLKSGTPLLRFIQQYQYMSENMTRYNFLSGVATGK